MLPETGMTASGLPRGSTPTPALLATPETGKFFESVFPVPETDFVFQYPVPETDLLTVKFFESMFPVPETDFAFQYPVPETGLFTVKFFENVFPVPETDFVFQYPVPETEFVQCKSATIKNEFTSIKKYSFEIIFLRSC